MLEKAPVGDAGDEEADKTHDHEAEREVEHRRSIVEKGVHRHQGEKADDDAVKPGEDFDEHLFGASRRMAVGNHHVDEPRRHRHDDEQRDDAGKASEKTHDYRPGTTAARRPERLVGRAHQPWAVAAVAMRLASAKVSTSAKVAEPLPERSTLASPT